MEFSLTIFSGENSDYASEGSCSIAVDSSYSEGVNCVRNESTSSEGLIHHPPPTRDPSLILFLEFYFISSDDPITLGTVYSVP